jgi:hypothetical protein
MNGGLVSSQSLPNAVVRKACPAGMPVSTFRFSDRTPASR